LYVKLHSLRHAACYREQLLIEQDVTRARVSVFVILLSRRRRRRRR